MLTQKTTRSFRVSGGRKMDLAQEISSYSVAQGFAQAIRRYTDKQLSRMAGASPRTFQNHRQGINAPSAVVLIKLMRESDEVFNAVLEMAGRDPAPHNQSARLRELINILKEDDNAVDHHRVS